jgi:hypothetical protein
VAIEAQVRGAGRRKGALQIDRRDAMAEREAQTAYGVSQPYNLHERNVWIGNPNRGNERLVVPAY